MSASHIDISKISSAIVCGASGGIGSALVRAILACNSSVKIWGTSRNPHSENLLNLEKSSNNRFQAVRLAASHEEDYQTLMEQVASQCERVDLLINCIGFLHGESHQPEKRFSDLDPQKLMASYEANCLPVALLGKHGFRLFKNKEPGAFVSLSARVGSIGDNRGGGWYGYRSSKSAHNMLMKNIALEFHRFHCNTLTLSIHPGTTSSPLSEPFIKNTPYTLHSTDQTASNLLKVLSDTPYSESGGFFDWQGKTVPW